MTAHDREQRKHRNPSEPAVRTGGQDVPAAPSMSELLASCAAADAVSKPPAGTSSGTEEEAGADTPVVGGDRPAERSGPGGRGGRGPAARPARAASAAAVLRHGPGRGDRPGEDAA